MTKLVTITGSNLYACNQKLQAIKAEFIKNYGDFGIEQIDCRDAEFSHIKEAALSPGLLSSEKLLILENASTNKDLASGIEELINYVPQQIQIIIFDPSIDKRTTFYKLLKKQGEFNDYSELDKPGLINWILDYVKANDGKIDRNLAGYFVDRVGSDQLLIKNEIDKLLLYNSDISRESIELLTVASPQSTIFDLVDAAFAGDIKRANRLYDEQRALKVEPQNIIAMITWQLHVLGLVKTAGSKTSTEIAKEAKISPFVIGKAQQIAKKMTFAKLKSLVSDLAKLDYSSKTKTLDLDEGLKNYLVRLAA